MLKTIIEILQVIEPTRKFLASDDFYQDGLIDSFGTISMIIAFEKAFSIEIQGEDITAENFKNITQILCLMEKYTKR